MDILKLYNDYGVNTAAEGDKHYRPGWVQVPCPFCTGNVGHHLGYNIQDNYFNCWRCGHKNTVNAIQNILKVSKSETFKIIRQYKGQTDTKNIKKIVVKKKSFKLPVNEPILDIPYHTRYMTKRGFSYKDIVKLQDTYNLRCSTNFVKIDDIDLSWRIIAPIIVDNKIVSWQTRDTTDKSPLKYITCPKSRETIHHKHLLYFEPDNKDIVILTEGIFDVWKIFLAGFPATCGFGVELKDEQIILLKQFKKVILFLDPDKAGAKKEMDLFRRLIFAGIKVDEVINLTTKDPGDMSKKEIRALLNGHFDK